MEFATDPDDPKVKDIYKQISDKSKITINYDRGIQYNIIDDMSVKNLVEKISYPPVTLTMKKVDNISISSISSIQEILKEVISKMLSVRLSFVDVTETQDAYIFFPYTDEGTAVYENPKYLSDFYNKCKVEDFIGYSLLSTSPLTRYVLEDEFRKTKFLDKNDFQNQNLKVKYFEDIALIKDDDNDQIVQNKISSLISQGYFAYRFTIHELEDLEVVEDLCKLFSINIIDTKDLSTLILQTDVDFKTTPEEWIRYNLPIIKSGGFPIFNILLDFSFYDDYNRLYGKVYLDTILKYTAYLAFAKLSDTHEIISPFINLIQINEDLSISVSLPSYALVSLFKQYVLEYLDNGISPSSNHKDGKFNIETCKNLREGIIKRYIVQKIDNDSYPMIIRDKTDNEILIHRSPLGIKYPSVFDYSDNNMKNSEKELLTRLRDFYKNKKICHDNLESVTYDKISEMNLDDLLNLIPVEENAIIYCFSNDTIQKLVKKENPLTRRPLSEKTIKTSKHLELGLRGLFDVGVLFGLYPSYPFKKLVPTDKGVIKMTRIGTDAKKRELVGNLFQIEIIYNDFISSEKSQRHDETKSFLFDISLPTVGLERIEDVKNWTEKLWYEGYFFSYWASAIVKYLNPASMNVIVDSVILKQAGDSIFDGNLAYEMLKNA